MNNQKHFWVWLAKSQKVCREALEVGEEREETVSGTFQPRNVTSFRTSETSPGTHSGTDRRPRPREPGLTKVQRPRGLRTIRGRACLDGDRRAAVAPGAGEEGEGPGGPLKTNQGQGQTPRNSRPLQMLPPNHGDCGPPDNFCH